MASAEVAVLMGSESDLPSMEGAFSVFEEFGVPFEARVISAHRTPEVAAEFAASAEANGIKVVICAAGMAAHLAGAVAAKTTLPVIGVPMACPPFDGMDALLATVQMPPGIPVAAVTVGKAGGKNSALFAVSILALSDPALAAKLKEYRVGMAGKVVEADKRVSKSRSKNA
jgi:phosphoribosylaminoimidazole carboxylase PurE protein